MVAGRKAPPKPKRRKAVHKDRDAGGLAPTERLFVDAYLLTCDERKAAIAAGYDRRTAREQGGAILERNHIGAAILEARNRILGRFKTETEDLVRELAKIAHANLADYMEMGEDGKRYICLDAVPYELMAALAEIKTEEQITSVGTDKTGKLVVRTTVKTGIKIKDKRAAIVDLLKINGEDLGDGAVTVRIIGGLPPEDES